MRPCQKLLKHELSSHTHHRLFAEQQCIIQLGVFESFCQWSHCGYKLNQRQQPTNAFKLFIYPKTNLFQNKLDNIKLSQAALYFNYVNTKTENEPEISNKKRSFRSTQSFVTEDLLPFEITADNSFQLFLYWHISTESESSSFLPNLFFADTTGIIAVEIIMVEKKSSFSWKKCKDP